MKASRKEELRGRLEAIKELKEQYYIGSWPALQYLRIGRKYEDMRAYLKREDPTIEQRIGVLSPVFLSWCKIAACHALQRMVEKVSVLVSTSDQISLHSQHYILDEDAAQPSRECAANENDHVWLVDCTRLVCTFLLHMKDTQASPTLISMQRELHSWIDHSFTTGKLKLTHLATEDQVSRVDLIANAQYRATDIDGFWEYVDVVIELEVEQKYESELSDDEQECLIQARYSRDVSLAHDLLHKCVKHLREPHHLDEDEPDIIDMLFRADYGRSQPGDDLLYDDNLYDRAEREYTLGLTYIERRILLNYLNRQPSFLVDREQAPSSLVQTLYERVREKMACCAGCLQRAQEAPDVSGDLLQILEKELRKMRYLFVAVQQNRKWLIEFLSR